MTRKAAFALLALCLLLPVQGLAQGKGNAAQGKGNAAKGKGIFLKNCMVCHNADGSGGKKLTATGNPSPDFRDPKFWESRTDAQIRETINKGVVKSGMIAWKGILRPQEIEDVMAYMKGLAKKSDSAKPAPAPTPEAMRALAPTTK